MGGALAEGMSQEGRVKICVKEEEDPLVRSFCTPLMPVNLWQAARRVANCEEGGGPPGETP